MRNADVIMRSVFPNPISGGHFVEIRIELGDGSAGVVADISELGTERTTGVD